MANVVPGNNLTQAQIQGLIGNYQQSTDTSASSLDTQPTYQGNLDYSQLNDPFDTLLSPISQNGGAGQFNESTSPGYQAYGQSWLNLLNTLQQTNANSNNLTPTTQDQELAILTAGPNASATYNPILDREFQSIKDQNDPLGNTTGGATSGLANKILNDYYSSGDFNGAASESLPAIAKQFGLDPSSPQAQQYADAYVTDILQGQQQDQIQNGFQDRGHDIFHQVVSGLGRAGADFLAGAGPGAIMSGAQAGALAASDAVESGIQAGATTGLDVFKAANSLPGLIRGGSGVLNGLESGDPISALTSGISLANGAVKLADVGSGLFGTAADSPSGSIFTDNISGTGSSDIGTLGSDNISQSTPLSSGNSVPLNGQSTSITDGQSTPLSEGNSVPINSGNSIQLPTSGGVPLTGSGGNSVPLPSTNGNISGTNGANNIPGSQASSGSPGGGVPGAGQLAGLLKGIFGTNNTNAGASGQSGDGSSQSSYGTNSQSAQLNPYEVAGVSQTGSFVDRQYYDMIDQIMKGSGSQAEKQAKVQAIIQQQAGG